MRLTLRLALANDKIWVKDLNFAVYRDLVLLQFGVWDPSDQTARFEGRLPRLACQFASVCFFATAHGPFMNASVFSSTIALTPTTSCSGALKRATKIYHRALRGACSHLGSMLSEYDRIDANKV